MKVVSRVCYHGFYTEGNWAGQRWRFFRHLSLQNWQTLYGARFHYSSDYIHAHPDAFDASTRCLARIGNLLEEAGELLQRTTTWHMRFAGSVIPNTLRDLSGKGRFCSRLRRALNDAAGRGSTWLPTLQGQVLDRFYEQLVRRRIINNRSQLIFNRTDPRLPALLQDCLLQAGVSAFDADSAGANPEVLGSALQRADMRLLWNSLSGRKKAAYVTGSIWSVGTQLGINTLLMLCSTSLLASVVGKTLALASLLYAGSFMLRLATTAQARCFQTHRGLPCGETFGGREGQYRSLAERMLLRTRQVRNRFYGTAVDGSPRRWIPVAGLHVDVREFRSASFACQGRHLLDARNADRWLAAAVERTQRVTDVLYAADTVSSRLIGRFIRSSFAAHHPWQQTAGLTAGGQCAYDWRTPAAGQTALGPQRLVLARLIGISGADALGACIGCFTVSAMWTVITKFSGGLGTVGLIQGTPLLVPLSSAAVGAFGWGVSLLLDCVRRASAVRCVTPSQMREN